MSISQELVDDALRGCIVLVVDDDSDTRELCESILAVCGATVIAAGSAAAALAIVETVRPDAVVSDIAMPEHDGYWLQRAPVETARSL